MPELCDVAGSAAKPQYADALITLGANINDVAKGASVGGHQEQHLTLTVMSAMELKDIFYSIEKVRSKIGPYIMRMDVEQSNRVNCYFIRVE